MQGIGRYSPQEVYKKGIQDLKVIETFLSDEGYFFGKDPHTIDACIYGFLANIYYYEIETPLRSFIQKSGKLPSYLDRVRFFRLKIVPSFSSMTTLYCFKAVYLNLSKCYM